MIKKLSIAMVLSLYGQLACGQAKPKELIEEISSIAVSLDKQKIEQEKSLEELGAMYLGLLSRQTLQLFEDNRKTFKRVRVWRPKLSDLETDACPDCFNSQLYQPVLAVEYQVKISCQEFFSKWTKGNDQEFTKAWDRLGNFSRDGGCSHNSQKPDSVRTYTVFVYDTIPGKQGRPKNYKPGRDPSGLIGFEGSQRVPSWVKPISDLKGQGYKFIKTDLMSVSKELKGDPKLLSQKSLSWKADKMSLLIYDYGILDGDIVDYYLDGKLIQADIKLEKQPYQIIIERGSSQGPEIIFVAKSCGSVGECTLQVAVEETKEVFKMVSQKGESMTIKVK